MYWFVDDSFIYNISYILQKTLLLILPLRKANVLRDFSSIWRKIFKIKINKNSIKQLRIISERSQTNQMNPIYNNNTNNTQQQFPVTSVATSMAASEQQGQQGVKRPLSLDFNQKSVKRKFNQSLQVSSVLNSPDLNKLGLASPDLEKLIMGNPTLQTPTPGMPVFSATNATSEQEEFTKGFDMALKQIKENNESSTVKVISSTIVSSMPATTTSTIINTMSGGGITYTNLDSQFPVAVKEEIQTLPSSSPPMSPIDMEDQERIKLERKRQRNRVAASKCRKRKLERISKLEDKVKILKGENAELSSVIVDIKRDVFKLKQQVIEHVKSGCTINLAGQF